MIIFKINTNGMFSVKEKTKEFYKMLIGGILFYLSLFFATKFTIDNEGFFIFLIIFLTLLYAYIFIFIPISLKLKINKVVREIRIDGDLILLITKHEFVFSKDSLNYKEVQNRFTGFSTRNKSGILLKTKEGKEFWIVEDFFNNYEDLRERLLNSPI